MSAARTVIVTGGLRGLGLEITRRLLDDHLTCVVSVSRTRHESLAELQSEFGDRIVSIAADLENVDSLKSKLDECLPSSTVLHGVVNNAAVAYDDLATNLNLERLENMFRVNVFAAMEITKWAIRRMLLHRTAGSLVHISSISVHTGYKGLAMYAATKGAMEAFSKNLAREWGSKKIRSNCIVAGFMETEMSAGLNEEQRRRIYARTAAKSPVDPQSVAETVAFLLSDTSRSITGQNVFVDNGTI